MLEVRKGLGKAQHLDPKETLLMVGLIIIMIIISWPFLPKHICL